MRRAAKENESEDKRRREGVETRNSADQLVFQSEKNLKDYGDKLPAEKRAKIEAALERLKAAQKGDDLAEMTSANEGLGAAWAEASQELYAAMNAQPGETGDGAAEGGVGGADTGDVKDADFEVVDEGDTK